jgi:2-dehydro-3-deoxyphosphogluconate aldolase / (4S)-4-hydroxy-2-oxoglutarate aldolase
MPTGGVEPTEANLTEWFKAGVICVGMGSQLLKSDLIKNKEFKKLEENVREAVGIVNRLRQQFPVRV